MGLTKLILVLLMLKCHTGKKKQNKQEKKEQEEICVIHIGLWIGNVHDLKHNIRDYREHLDGFD